MATVLTFTSSSEVDAAWPESAIADRFAPDGEIPAEVQHWPDLFREGGSVGVTSLVVDRGAVLILHGAEVSNDVARWWIEAAVQRGLVPGEVVLGDSGTDERMLAESYGLLEERKGQPCVIRS